MWKERTVPYVECDGCAYVIDVTRAEAADGLKAEDRMSRLTIPWDTDGRDRTQWTILEFHFHGPQGRSCDCYRYWATSPRIMRRSLEERGLSAGEIDDFMATHLYRDRSAA